MHVGEEMLQFNLVSLALLLSALRASSFFELLPEELLIKIAVAHGISIMALLAQTNNHYKTLFSKIAYDHYEATDVGPDVVWFLPSVIHFCLSNPTPAHLNVFAQCISMACNKHNIHLMSSNMDHFKKITEGCPSLIQEFRDQIYQANNVALDEEFICIADGCKCDPFKFYFPLMKAGIPFASKLLIKASLYSLAHVAQRQIMQIQYDRAFDDFVLNAKRILDFFEVLLAEEFSAELLKHADTLQLLGRYILYRWQNHTLGSEIVLSESGDPKMTIRDSGSLGSIYKQVFGYPLPEVAEDELIRRVNELGEPYVSELLATVMTFDQMFRIRTKLLLEYWTPKLLLICGPVASDFFKDLLEPNAIPSIEGIDSCIVGGIRTLLIVGDENVQAAIRQKVWICRDSRTFKLLSTCQHYLVRDGLSDLVDGPTKSFMDVFPIFMHDKVIELFDDLRNRRGFIYDWIINDVNRIVASSDLDLLEKYQLSLQSSKFRSLFKTAICILEDKNCITPYFPDLHTWPEDARME